MNRDPSHRVVRVIGLMGCGLALLCTPLVAPLAFALGPLHAEDLAPLWLFSISLLVGSVLLATKRFRNQAQLAACAFPLLLLLALELAVRIVVINSSEARAEMLVLARRTYHDHTAKQPHPFLQFTGKPAATLQGNAALGRMTPYNERGFFGPDYSVEKPPNTLRIACLGGSTTARGYPYALGKHIEAELPGSQQVEAMNLGLGFYTSAHSLVNLVLNVVDYQPDYVVFHHAWNDSHVRNRADPVRGDYSHALKAFEYPDVWDAWLIRGSVIYRFVKDRLSGEPEWAYMTTALVTETARKPGWPFHDLLELVPYKRNIETVADFALLRGAVPVLTTMPFSTDPDTPYSTIAVHIDQCNQVTRQVAKQYTDRAVFVDLDEMIRPTHQEFFIDLGHMNDAGKRFKAKAIGDAILAHLRRSGVD